MINKVLLFHNQMLMVFDEGGEQISKYQGKLKERYKLILKDAPSDTKFYLAIWQGESKEISREAFEEYGESND